MQPTKPATHDNLAPIRLNFCPIASLCRNEIFVRDTRCDTVCFTHFLQFQQDRSGPADSSPKTSPFSGFASAACEWPSGKGLAGHATTRQDVESTAFYHPEFLGLKSPTRLHVGMQGHK